MQDNGSVIESYEYTPNGLISKKTTSKTNVTVDYEYNNAGQVKKITVKKGNTIVYHKNSRRSPLSLLFVLTLAAEWRLIWI